MRSVITLISMIFLALLLQRPAVAELPNLNQDSYGGLTLSKEYQLGRNWVRQLRRQAPLMKDPASGWYLEQLTWALAANSQLTDRRLEIIPLDNKTFNAFAVPGGIIGLHGGLLLAAESEGELASVISHELAHLSQRHFAAQVEQQRINRPLMLAGLLGSILLTTVNSDAGVAGIQSTLAADVSSRLKFSRRNEREADRIGMQTLEASGYNPHGMPKMFSRLLENYRFASRPPEFLSTHPLSESRISDTAGRAVQLAGSDTLPWKDPLLFSLVKARLQASYADNPSRLAEQIEGQLANSSGKHLKRLHYAQYAARVSANQQQKADASWDALDRKLKQHWLVQLTRGEQLVAARRLREAISIYSKQLQLYPDSYPLQQRLAEALHQNGDIKGSLKLYRKLATRRPTDVNIRYQLAEIYGLAGDIGGVHTTRTEYFMLTGNIDKALRQIKFGRRETGISEASRQKLDQLEREARDIREQMKASL